MLIAAGTSSYRSLSFVSIPNDVIAACAFRLGISFGTSPSQIDSSVNSLEDLEESRRLNFLQNNLPPVDDEDKNSLFLHKASNLCEDLDNYIEEGLEDYLDLLSRGVKVIGSRKKVVVNKLNLRRSTRLQRLNSNFK